MQHSTGSQEDNNQPGKESLQKGFGEKSLMLLSNTSSMDLQIHTKSQSMATEAQPFAILCLSWLQGDSLPCPEMLPMFPWGPGRLEKPPATSGWWGEAQTNPETTVTIAKCPTCSWQGSHYTPASPRAGWWNRKPMAVKQKHPTARRNEVPD